MSKSPTNPIVANRSERAAILARYPLPNTNFNGFNFIASENRNTVDNVQLYRWDHNFSEKAMLMVRTMEEKQGLGNINNQLWGDDNFPSVSSDWNFQAWNSVAKLTYLVTPHVVNDFQAGYTQNFIHFQDQQEFRSDARFPLRLYLHRTVPPDQRLLPGG